MWVPKPRILDGRHIARPHDASTDLLRELRAITEPVLHKE